MKKIAIAVLIGLAISGCNNKTEEIEEAKPPAQATAPSNPVKAETPDMTVTYKQIQDALFQLKASNDPKLDEILDIIENAGTDGVIDQAESKYILDNIQLHMAQLSAGDAQIATSATPQPSNEAPKENREDIGKNPNPFK